MTELYKAIALGENKELEEFILAKANKYAYLGNTKETFDLFPFYSILVSTGTNLNLDAFDRVQLWEARHSPVHKPVNIGHAQTRIVGHIFDNIVVGEDLKPIPEDTAAGDLPYKLHVITAAVIYKIWEDQKVQAEINDIIAKISAGELYVSMECLFRDFDYLLTSASGEQTVIRRTPETTKLTKYLRQYKGSGKVCNRTIARLLKQITFSAVGLVVRPANPASVINDNLNIFGASANESVYINLDTKNQEIIMAETIAVAETDAGGFNHNYNVEDHPTYKGLFDKHSALMHAHEALSNEHNRLKTDHGHLHGRVEELNKKLDDVHKKTLAASAMKECDSAGEPKGSDKPKDEVEKERSAADDSGEDADESMASLKSTVASLNEKIATLETEKVALATANDAEKKTIEEFRKASRDSHRAEALMGVDSTYTKETALQAVAKFSELSEVGFDGMLAIVKSYASKAPKEVSAKQVIENARAEAEAQYGGTNTEINKAAAEVSAWLKSTRSKPKKSEK